MSINYVVDKKDLKKFKAILRQAFREELGCEIKFVQQRDGSVKILPKSRVKHA